MIVASVVTRGVFCGYAACTLATVFSPSPRPSQRPAADRSSSLPSLSTSYYYAATARNAEHASPPLTDVEKEKVMLLASRIVRDRVSSAIKADPTLAGPILRLAFHDAATREANGDDGKSFTGGSNGSVRYELDWSENRGLGRPLAAVQSIHEEVSGLDLSFADTVALAGAAAVESAGGPWIGIKLGRVDASESDARRRRHPIRKETDRSLVDTTLPSAGLDSDGMRLFFGSLGLTEEEFVALCGAHDLGRHVTLLGMPKECLKNLTRACLENAPVSVPFVTEDPDTLSNLYFKNLLRWNNREVKMGEVAFIPTDVTLVVDVGLKQYVEKFANDEGKFFQAFGKAYQTLVDASASSRNQY